MSRGCVYALEILYYILTAMLIVKMAGRGQGRRGRPRGTGQAQSVFDQQTFAEAVGVTANAIAQAGIAGRQEDPSNLQRFRTHYPPTFTGGRRSDSGRPLVHADRESVRGYGDYL